ncbi:MAG: aminotransferase class V-fold PLP-dependent enzyme [Chloroflexi bacterium]|nr:aminotransferase class V-fold PLP-dependent enzyme [Chloroflexota bacterium]MBI4505343.1 aminotransferase class V-fold PLP-dependent enzyme [Chloroflexota bacterium]
MTLQPTATIDEVRRLFPVTREWAYFGHCAVSPLSLPAAEAMRVFIDDRLHRGIAGLGDHGLAVFADRARERAARLIGAAPEEIALVQNTVVGVNIVAQGLDWQPGDTVVTADVEFPANYFPWANLADRGVLVKLVRERDGRVPADDVLAAIDDRTRVVALSFVEFTNGYRNDLATIGRACRERGVLFAVDAIQGLGALEMDVAAQCVDFLAAGGHKWLLGPIGTGIFYCRRALLDRLRVAFLGHNSMVRRPEYLPHVYDLWPDARRFEGGAQNSLGVAGLAASIDLLLGLGPAAVERRVLELTDYVIAGLRERDCEVLSPLGARERSGIVAFRSRRTPTPALVRRLAEQRIFVAPRSGGIRVAPHVYNREEELDRLLALVP